MLTVAAGLVMKIVSMVDFRLHAEKIINDLRNGQRIILTRRGKPVARLEPIVNNSFDADDPFFSLDALADVSGESLTNAQIDDIVYGP
jgi:antitoxin (DNA-binding transcriptional repressor) of toxin-antitoxin stability system